MNNSSLIDRLYDCLARQVPRDYLAVLERSRQQIAEGASDRIFLTAFSAVSRYTGKATLQLTEEEIALFCDWEPYYNTLDEAGRSLLLLSLPHTDVERYYQILAQLVATAGVRELVAFYRTLPLLPDGDRLVPLAREGVRSNMSAVFDSIALKNPYPARYFDEDAWNQMVLKALFIGSSIDDILHLNDRANSNLARMALDYARERRSAKRTVPLQLWRLVGEFATEDMINDIAIALEDADSKEREAVALAVGRSPNPQVRSLLAKPARILRF